MKYFLFHPFSESFRTLFLRRSFYIFCVKLFIIIILSLKINSSSHIREMLYLKLILLIYYNSTLYWKDSFIIARHVIISFQKYKLKEKPNLQLYVFKFRLSYSGMIYFLTLIEYTTSWCLSCNKLYSHNFLTSTSLRHQMINI